MSLYFAYGSNMNPQRIKERISRLPYKESASLPGYKLCFNKQAHKKPGIGYANVVQADGEAVYGILYQVTEDELLQIDRHEGVRTGHYSRAKVAVLIHDGKEVIAVTYVACPNRISDGLLPERCYLDHFLAGKDNLPEAYVRFLESHPVAATVEE